MEEKEFNQLLKEIEKNFGKGSVLELEGKADENVEVISTGSLIIDDLTGVGGYPKGRIIEIFGPESSGKTTLTLFAISELNKIGKTAAFIDVEHSLDLNFAKKLGVNLKNIIVSQPDSGEQALEIVDHLVKSGKIDLIVIDSVAALTPLAELEGRMDESTIGAQARLMAKSLRKISGNANKTKTTIIFINQIREKVGVIFGNPEITPGGRSLKFFASLRIDVRLKERIKIGDEVVGQIMKIKIIKNKLASPYRVGEIYLDYNLGIDKNLELIEIALKNDIISRKGSWFYYGEEKMGQGKIEAKRFIEENNIFEKISNETKTKI